MSGKSNVTFCYNKGKRKKGAGSGDWWMRREKKKRIDKDGSQSLNVQLQIKFSQEGTKAQIRDN